jgi:DNA-directed RNA polymerase specialized sigma24 family protein
MVQGVYGDGLTIREAARHAGLDRRSGERVLKRALRRMAHPGFKRMITWLPRLPEGYDQVAAAVWLRGESIRDVCEQLSISKAEVRKRIEFLRGVIYQPITDRSQ